MTTENITLQPPLTRALCTLMALTPQWLAGRWEVPTEQITRWQTDTPMSGAPARDLLTLHAAFNDMVFELIEAGETGEPITFYRDTKIVPTTNLPTSLYNAAAAIAISDLMDDATGLPEVVFED